MKKKEKRFASIPSTRTVVTKWLRSAEKQLVESEQKNMIIWINSSGHISIRFQIRFRENHK